jgi:hypothetical protein
MLLVNIFLAIIALKLISADAVTCVPKYKSYREKFNNYLHKKSDNFVAVSYASIQEQNLKKGEQVTNEIERHFTTTHVPISLVANENDTFIYISSKDAVHQIGSFKSIQKSFQEDLSPEEQGKVYVFGSTIPVENRSETLFFETCLVKRSNNELTIEKSILVLVLGEILDKKEIVWNIKAKPLNMTAFKFAEFEVQRYAVCDHLKYYFNECVEPEIKLWIFFVEFLLFVIGGVVAVKYFAKNLRRMSNKTKPKAVIVKQRKIRRNQVAPISSQVASISSQVAVRQVSSA